MSKAYDIIKKNYIVSDKEIDYIINNISFMILSQFK